ELAAFMGSTNNIERFNGETKCNTRVSSNVNAVIDIDGTLAFIHSESGEGDDSKRPSAATYWFGYSKTENPQLWNDASPLTHAGIQNPPILFLNSSVARMHAGRNDYISIMNKYGIYTEVHEFENAPHSFCLFEPWFDPTVKYIDDFLKKVFNNNEKK
ncbi:MAG: pectin esterase, partial [Bacteroidetes bacterium]|nr:pectin esterase [Bacteroidota bacterium]